MHIPMLKVDVALPRNKWKELLEVLESWGHFHPEVYNGGNKAKLEEEESELRAKAKRIISYIAEIEGFFGEITPLPNKGDLDYEGVKRIREGLQGFIRDINTFEEELKRISDYFEIANAVDRIKGEGEEVFAVVLGKGEAASKEILKKWALERGVEVVESVKGDRVLLFLKTKRENAEGVRKFLEESAFPLVRPPKGYKTLEEVKKALEEDIPSALKGLKEEAKASFESVRVFLERQKYIAEDILFYLDSKEKYLAFSKFLTSIKGWIPAHLKGEFLRIIKNIDEGAVVKFSKPKNYEFENVPVVLKNSPPASYYQSFLDLYAPPVYKTVDPSVFLAIFFPIYYGFMLGDAGYGIVGMLLFWLLSNAFKPNSMGYNLSMVYFINSIFATIFGIIFGEIFGDFGIKMGIIQPLFHRTHEVIDLILIAVGFGFLQMLLGMLLGVYNYWILEHKKHSLFELGRFFAILGILLAVVSYVRLPGITPEWMYGIPPYIGLVGWFSLSLGVILTLIAEGPLGVIEIFSAFGNVLSYARLAAVGLASAILAEIANKFIELVPIPAFAILVAFVFHALAFVLGIVDPTIQGMRLQFVEFFTKFYVPAIKMFKPLKKGGGI
ncbi:MAG: V-type ATPase 116kDa subunit family protein [candidate division WOR-3 bacterium]